MLAWAGRTLVHLCLPRQQQVRTRKLWWARPSLLIPVIRRAWRQAAGPTILEPDRNPHMNHMYVWRRSMDHSVDHSVG